MKPSFTGDTQVSIMIMIPFAFVGASFVSPLVAERESGARVVVLV